MPWPFSLFSSKKEHGASSATDAKKTNEADAFQAMASNEPGLLIATCSIRPSGCIDWGRRIKAEFPKMDSVCLEDTTAGYHCYDMPKISPWKYIVITGCSYETFDQIIELLPDQYHLKQIKDIYVILPPHLTYMYNTMGSDNLETIQYLLTTIGYHVHVLKAGVDLTHSCDIGMPKLYPEFHSTYHVPENCFGLIYHRHLSSDNGPEYFENYFKQIAVAGKNCKKSPITVIAISIDDSEDDSERALVGYCARKYGIQIDFIDKLPQADFLNAMKEIGEKGGIISADGAYTLMQALDLGATTFAYSGDNNLSNKLFYHQLIDKLPTSQQPLAAVMLGQSDNYELLNEATNAAAMKRIISALQKFIQDSTKKFDTDHQKHQLFKRIDNPTAGQEPTDVKKTHSKEQETRLKIAG